MFTQRDEEKYILEFFKNYQGRFLDIGAHDGKCFSTTHALALKNWSGICVEPSPSVFPALCERYKNNPSITSLQYAIGDVTGEIDFYNSNGDMISSLDLNHVKLWEKKAGVKFKKIKVNCLTVKDLFISIGYGFDFISIDVEGTNLSLLKDVPFDKLTKTKMLCIEFELKIDEVMGIVESYGFYIYHQTAENLLLVRK